MFMYKPDNTNKHLIILLTLLTSLVSLGEGKCLLGNSLYLGLYVLNLNVINNRLQKQIQL